MGVSTLVNGEGGSGSGTESSNKIVKMSTKDFGSRGCSMGGGFKSGPLKMIVRKASGRDMCVKVKAGTCTKMVVLKKEYSCVIS